MMFFKSVVDLRFDEYSMMFFKSVVDLSFIGPFAVLGFAKYQYRPLRVSTDGLRYCLCTVGSYASQFRCISPDLAKRFDPWTFILRSYEPISYKKSGCPICLSDRMHRSFLLAMADETFLTCGSDWLLIQLHKF